MKRYIALLLMLVLLVTLVPVQAFAAGDLTATSTIRNIIKDFEGCKLTAYKLEGESNYTIGYGHSTSSVYKGMTISQAQAESYFAQDIAVCENEVNKFNMKYNCSFSQNEFDALVSMAYNFGAGFLESKSWRICQHLKNGFRTLSDVEIADAIGCLCDGGVPGLLRRRILEAKIFLYGDYNNSGSNDLVSIKFTGGSPYYGENSGRNGNTIAIFIKGAPYGSLPTVKSSNGRYFAGWETGSGAVINNSTVATGSLTVSAKWSSTPVSQINGFSLTVINGGGSGVYSAGEVIPLTVKELPNKSFTGWVVTGGTAPTVGSDGMYSFKMPGKDVTITATYRDIAPTNGCRYTGNLCPSRSFKDVPTDFWAHRAIDYAVDSGLFNGTSENYFQPNTSMTRGMVVTVLYRLSGSPSVAGLKNPFSDLEDNSYRNAILWASDKRIANGFADGSFRANQIITREQLATFLMRFANNVYNVNTEDYFVDLGDIFTDANDVAEPYREAVSWAVAEGIIAGTSVSTISPEQSATRAQVAIMLMRFTGGAL